MQNIKGQGPVPSLLNLLNPQPGPVIGFCHGGQSDNLGLLSTLMCLPPEKAVAEPLASIDTKPNQAESHSLSSIVSSKLCS